jgi:acyl carrier protein
VTGTRAEARGPEAAGGFVEATLEWLRRDLLPAGVHVDESTPLFAGGLIDSIRILKLIAWTEHATGRQIPDEQIRMDNFRTVRRIADVFVERTVVGRTPAAARARRSDHVER